MKNPLTKLGHALITLGSLLFIPMIIAMRFSSSDSKFGDTLCAIFTSQNTSIFTWTILGLYVLGIAFMLISWIQRGCPKKAKEEKGVKHSVKEEVMEWVSSLVWALMFVFLLTTFGVQIIRVDGTSMYNTLDDGERLIVTMWEPKLHQIERNDIIICRYPGRGLTSFVKRAVAVEGDTVYRENNITYVVYGDTGEIVELDAMNKDSYYYQGEDYSITLGKNEYFAVGDNRANSHDSRSEDVGVLTGDMILGKVRCTIFPTDRFGSVYTRQSTWNDFYNDK